MWNYEWFRGLIIDKQHNTTYTLIKYEVYCGFEVWDDVTLGVFSQNCNANQLFMCWEDLLC